jgi:cell division protease FtsH
MTMINRIFAVALCASLLAPAPAAAQALRLVVDAPALAPAMRIAPLAPASFSFAAANLSPALLTPGVAALAPVPVAAAVPVAKAVPVADVQAQPQVHVQAYVNGLATAKAPETFLAKTFDGSLAANDASFAVAAAPAPVRPSLLSRSQVYGATALAIAIPGIHQAGASLSGGWIAAMIGGGLVSMLFVTRWIEGSKTVQFYLARRRWATANYKKWSEADDMEKAAVEADAERIVAQNKAGRWPGNRKANQEMISIRPKDEPGDAPSPAPSRPAVGKIDPVTGKVIPPVKVLTFADVAGQDDAKHELEKVVNYIKNPERYRKLGAKGFRGVLLFGPPGTGKTLIARAVAGEAGATWHETNGSEFVNTYVGKGPSNVREAFAKARGDGKKPGILFVDEIDAIGKKRDGENNSEYENTLNSFLAEMSSPKNDNVVVIAATNLPELLDPALVRGRRFGLKVPVGLPDIDGREAILKVHSKDMPFAPGTSLRAVAELTPGLSGADLEEIINDAAMLAADREGTDVNDQDFRKAVERQTIGHERKLVMTAVEKKVVANHESGHALVAWLVPNGDQIRKITIVPHGLQALGLVQTMAAEEKHMYSKSWLEDRIAIALGGRVAEQLTTGETFSGAQNDFEQATRMARMMVMKFGMSEQVGHVSYDMQGQRPVVGGAQSERMNELIDAEVKRIIDEQTVRVVKLLTDNRAYLDGMAGELMTRETLREEDLARLLPPRPNK